MGRRFVAGREPVVKQAAPPTVEPVKKRGRPKKDEAVDATPAKKAVGFQPGNKNPKYLSGELSKEVEISKAAFDEMEKEEKLYYDEIDRMTTEKKWSVLEVVRIKRQARRVARLNAILKSNYGRMTVEMRYRRRIQEPNSTEAFLRAEAQVQKQEAILAQMMGQDEMYEAKVDAARGKQKPAELQVLMGGSLDKKRMAAGGGDDGDDE